MGRIRVLPDHVANKIAAGEVVERPASVVKELLENSLDAGARRMRLHIEAGGRKLIQLTDDGCGMLRDDALLAFERHATSKIRDADDLLNIATLGFRGEALPSIASVSRFRLETRAEGEPSGTTLEIAGGKLLKVEEAGLPAGTSITVRDLFFNVPARKKFLRAESTEQAHIVQLVTHYALAHPDKHFELHSPTHALLTAPPVAGHAERIFQIFGRETLDQLLPVAAQASLAKVGVPQPPPWRIEDLKAAGEWEEPAAGDIRLHGFVSRPEIQKLNRNSIFIFVNGRLVRDRLVQHALTEAYRNILPPTVFPVVLLFIELPPVEVDCNVHPSKTEVRFRQQSFVHDFVRDSIRAALVAARPVPHFTREIHAQPSASPALSPGAAAVAGAAPESAFTLQPPSLPPQNARLEFAGGIAVEANAAIGLAPRAPLAPHCGGALPQDSELEAETPPLASLKPLGQVRDSFIIAASPSGLWIIDQHVAHERILFEQVLRRRDTAQAEGQRLLMPLIVELSPAQLALFAEIAAELRANGFDVEPFGSRTIAVKTAPAGVSASDVERLLTELLTQFEREEQSINLERVRHKIAASIACHAAIKINTPLDQRKMEWLLAELALTECPMSCPHGRPVVLRYSVEDIQKAFKRI